MTNGVISAIAEAEWQGILEPGETILWQGAPDTGRILTPIPLKHLAGFAVLLAAAGIADLSGKGIGDGMLALRLLVLGVLLVVAWQAIRFWDRRRNFYTLTDRRAIIGTWKFGIRNLQTVGLFTDAPLILSERGESWLSFATENKSVGGDIERVEVGFRGLRDPQVPWRIIRDLRARAKGATGSVGT
jgi:hypothetical protein